MATWKVKENGVVINTIVASEEFAAMYEKETGYTLEFVEPEPVPEAPESTEVSWDAMAEAIMEGVNDV